QCSINEAVKKYEVSSTSVLRKWIKKYNSHSEFKDTAKGRSNTMTKRKKRIGRNEYTLHVIA
ncbi:hypothetical protein, partial [Alkalihalophilus pseudofirmus]|uniref:hypothetical protein n=1 Tax=Alkalihalophilus pseudofirmus TaxID=79885 RepID=UPI001C37BFEC